MEAFQSIKDAPLTACPSCGMQSLERLISATSFQLKGGGWYKDLYSSSKPANSSSEKSSDKKSDKAA
jgi:putative FmdB family regulatory protein